MILPDAEATRIRHHIIEKYGLREKQIETMLLLYRNRDISNKELSDKLCVTEKTIKFRLGICYKATGCKNRQDLYMLMFTFLRS